MKKTFLHLTLLVTILVVSSGCATWEGIKKDTSDGWEATKSAINEATE